MEIVFHLVFFSFIITTCHGFGDNWVLKKQEGFFITYSQLFWYYTCSCPPTIRLESAQIVALNDEGYGKPQYEERTIGCVCKRSLTPKGSSHACTGCEPMYQYSGQNRYIFFHSCYCKGKKCTDADSKSALDYMMTLNGTEKEQFNVACVSGKSSEDSFCQCETYSARKGSELVGCTRDKGWFPCPQTIQDYEDYYKSQIDIYYKGNDQPLTNEMKPELSRRRR